MGFWTGGGRLNECIDVAERGSSCIFDARGRPLRNRAVRNKAVGGGAGSRMTAAESVAPVSNGWRVPMPRVAARQLYRIVWLGLFGLALVSVLYIGVRNEIRLQNHYGAASALGFSTYVDPNHEGMLGGPLSDVGRRIGFKNYDTILAVDGVRVPADMGAQAAMLSGPDGGSVVLTIRRASGERVQLRVIRDTNRLKQLYRGTGFTFQLRRGVQFGFYFLASVTMIAAGALLFIRRPRDPIAQLLSLAMIIPSISTFDLVALTTIFLFAPVLLALAILLFPNGRFSSKWHWFVLLLFVVDDCWSLLLYYHPGDTPVRAALRVLAPVSLMIAIAVQHRKTPAGIVRQQGKFILFGIVAMCLLNLFSSGLKELELQPWIGAQVLPWVILAKHLCIALGRMAMPAGLLVSLFRYRLYDAESAISRSVVYGALTLILLAVFAGSEKIIEVLGEEYFGHDLGALAAGLGAAVAAVMIAPLHHHISRWAERRFQGNLVGLSKELPLLVADMRETSTPREVAEASLLRLTKGLRAIRGAVTTDDGPLVGLGVSEEAVQSWRVGWSEPSGSAIELDAKDELFPVRLPLDADGVGRAGWLLLGSRPDGSILGKDEREVLHALADPIARALAVAAKHQLLEKAHRGELASIRERIAWIEAWISGDRGPAFI